MSSELGGGGIANVALEWMVSGTASLTFEMRVRISSCKRAIS